MLIPYSVYSIECIYQCITVECIQYFSVYCLVHRLQYIKDSVSCTVYSRQVQKNVYRIVQYSVYCIVCIIQCIQFSVYSNMYPCILLAQCPLYSKVQDSQAETTEHTDTDYTGKRGIVSLYFFLVFLSMSDIILSHHLCLI